MAGEEREVIESIYRTGHSVLRPTKSAVRTLCRWLSKAAAGLCGEVCGYIPLAGHQGRITLRNLTRDCRGCVDYQALPPELAEMIDEETFRFNRLLSKYHVPVSICADKLTGEKMLFYSSHADRTVDLVLREFMHATGMFTSDEIDETLAHAGTSAAEQARAEAESAAQAALDQAVEARAVAEGRAGAGDGVFVRVHDASWPIGENQRHRIPAHDRYVRRSEVPAGFTLSDDGHLTGRRRAGDGSEVTLDLDLATMRATFLVDGVPQRHLSRQLAPTARLSEMPDILQAVADDRAQDKRQRPTPAQAIGAVTEIVAATGKYALGGGAEALGGKGR